MMAISPLKDLSRKDIDKMCNELFSDLDMMAVSGFSCKNGLENKPSKKKGAFMLKSRKSKQPRKDYKRFFDAINSVYSLKVSHKNELAHNIKIIIKEGAICFRLAKRHPATKVVIMANYHVPFEALIYECQSTGHDFEQAINNVIREFEARYANHETEYREWKKRKLNEAKKICRQKMKAKAKAKA